MNRNIGEVFDYNGVKLKVVDEHEGGGDYCEGCYFKLHNIRCAANEYQLKGITGHCSSGIRGTSNGVKFKEIKELKKSDLRAGNIIECANGDFYLIAYSERDGLYGLNNDGWLDLSDFEEDFTCKPDKNFNINNVYSGQQPVGLAFIRERKGTCLWNREGAKVELTLEDIAKKFDIPVDKLRIKD